MTTPEQIVDGMQADNSVSGQLARIVARLNRLPAKAGREGESPSVWRTFGECMVRLEEALVSVAELEEELEDVRSVVRAVFSPDPTSWEDIKRKIEEAS